MKCFRCGTEYFGIECPTCAQKRLSEERNRQLEEQNRKLSEQTRLMEEQNNRERDERQRLKDEQQEEARQERLEEEFHERLEELFGYATERELKTAYVDSDFSEDIWDEEEPWDESEDSVMNDFQIQSCIEKHLGIIKNKCTPEYNKLLEAFNSDDRYLNAGYYGKVFTPQFKLLDIQQVLKNHTTDYVIIPSEDNQLTIFPLSVITSNTSLKGYGGKKIKIGSFRHLMFLKDIKEAEKVAQIFSTTSKQVRFAKKEVQKVIEEYLAKNPRPQLQPDNSDTLQYTKESSAAVIDFIVCVSGGAFLGYITATELIGFSDIKILILVSCKY